MDRDDFSAQYGRQLLLTDNVELAAEWELPAGDTTLCLNGHSITLNAAGAVIDMQVYGTIFTLYDCIGMGTITHGKDSTDNTYNGCGVVVGGTFNMYGGKITGNVKTDSGSGGGVLVAYGTFNMYSGAITNNSCESSGGGVSVDHGTFNMSGGEISCNTSKQNGGGIELSSSTFTMTAGSICKNKEENNYGGGIYVSYGSTFTMNGGTITANESWKGGGVYVEEETSYGKNTFNMNGGTITSNTATTNTGKQPGGGVYVASNSIFTMSGAVKITGNTYKGAENNVYLFDNNENLVPLTITGALGEDASIGVSTYSVATVGSPVTIAKGDGYTLTDADAACFRGDTGYSPALDGDEVKLYKNPPQKHPICGATCTHGGRHPALVWEGITDLADAANAGNYYLMDSVTRTDEFGSFFCNNDVNLCLNGHSITAEHDSYTIRVQNGAKLTLTDCGGNSGTITHGSDKMGSGVMVNNGCSFIMYGGTICGNTAVDSGSGVIVNGGSRFTMYGGAITENNTTGDISCGGVYVASNGTFTVSGAAKIQDNWRNGTLQGGVYVQGSGTASNVGLTPDTTITIVEGLTEEASIGVSKRLPLTKADNVRIATGAAKELDYKKIFPLDVNDPDYSVIRDGDGNLSIHLHEHGWIYQLSGDGATVTAVCNDAATCPTDGGNGGSVTLKAPAADMLTYDGTAKSVTLDGSFVKDKTIPTEMKVTYNVKDGDALEGAPVNAGTYTASITCIGADDKSVTASVDYTIKKATLTAGDFTVTLPADLVYDGEAKYATVSSTKINGNYIYVKYKDANGNLDQATKAGTYKVLVTAKGDPNYNEVNQLQDSAWTFTIQKAKPVIQLTVATQTLVKNDKEVDISKWATFNNNDSDAKLTYELVDNPTGITLTGNMLKAEKADTTVNAFQIRVTAAATENFEAPEEKIITVNVVDKIYVGIDFKNISESPTVTYGDADFSLTAALTRTVPAGDNGKWSWESSDDSVLEIVSGADTATPTIRAKKAGYSQLTVTYTGDTYYGGPVGVSITVQAAPTGEPKYTVITADGKTLADAGLTLTGSTLNPAVGTLEWIDDAGNVLPNDTKVEVNKNYKWRFKPEDVYYTALTGEITLYPVYRIIDGADSSWTQSTDGSGSIKIRGNGEFSKFVDVKVDGNVVDPTNYTAREGSTIIELHADYLKTLSEGSHTFEIAWTDGTASTGFTVAKNTSGNDDTGNNGNDDSNKDSNNDSSNNNSGSNNTAGSGDNTAQTLPGSPNTGDASGLWIILFVASAAGLAVMLVRRKKQ
mgnify:CR=1 FL=1